ncbi:MAG: hypothetical protein AB1486_30565 [Planctomycetota bacterium]
MIIADQTAHPEKVLEPFSNNTHSLRTQVNDLDSNGAYLSI